LIGGIDTPVNIEVDDSIFRHAGDNRIPGLAGEATPGTPLQTGGKRYNRSIRFQSKVTGIKRAVGIDIDPGGNLRVSTEVTYPSANSLEPTVAPVLVIEPLVILNKPGNVPAFFSGANAEPVSREIYWPKSHVPRWVQDFIIYVAVIDFQVQGTAVIGCCWMFRYP